MKNSLWEVTYLQRAAIELPKILQQMEGKASYGLACMPTK